MTATFRLTNVCFCVYLDISDECSIIHVCTNFPKSGATSKLYTQNMWAEASSIQGHTNIRRYCTKYATIHETQNNVAWIINMHTVFHTFHDFQKYKFHYTKIILLHICTFRLCITKMKWILSSTIDINCFVSLQAQFNMHTMIHTAYKMWLSGSAF
jgi:hypothetical protein